MVIDMAKHIEKAWEFYRKIGSPKFVVAPMVNQSELAFRMMTRKYGAHLCYTPMLHSALYVRDPNYRDEQYHTCPEDRPLFAQFCGHDPQLILQAAKLVQHEVDAVDINLGCPQGIAKRGRYGAFLLEDFETIKAIVETLSAGLDVPVTCKIRVFNDEAKTLRLAQMIQDAGCSLLTVHGRTKENTKTKIGPNNFDIIKKIKQTLNIPVFANGGVAHLSDIPRILEYTGCDGVMVSEAILEIPTFFSPVSLTPIQMAREYLQFAEQYKFNDVDMSCLRGHLFKILYHLMNVHTDLRLELATKKPEEFPAIIDRLEKAIEAQEDKSVYEKELTWYNRHIIDRSYLENKAKEAAELQRIEKKKSEYETDRNKRVQLQNDQHFADITSLFD